jgi:hypothetical protein
MSLFDVDKKGNLITEQSMLDHINDGKVPKCPACKNMFRNVGEDRVEGELMGTRYKCIYCSKELLVIND